jgi:hypothetical protein
VITQSRWEGRLRDASTRPRLDTKEPRLVAPGKLSVIEDDELQEMMRTVALKRCSSASPFADQ